MRRQPSRRELLRMAAVAGGGIVAAREALAAEVDARKLGIPLGPYGERSPFEKAVRWRRESKTPETGSSFTPLHDSVGIVTPSSLHYERHHSGIPTIDPARHRLVIHGMVDRPLSLSMAEIRRLPSVTRIARRSSAAATAAASGAPRRRRRPAQLRPRERQRVDRRAACRCCSPKPACSRARRG